jgi:hypothetical protein
MKNTPKRNRAPIYPENTEVKRKKMLSRDCDGCSQMKVCSTRYRKVGKGGKVYCPDGTVHLVDEENVCYAAVVYERFAEA